MGEVWRASDSKLKREVAIKVLPAGFVADPDRLARFEREAQLLAQLNHSNVAHVYGMETSGHEHALVMELVDGPTLAERLAKGALPVEEALAIARQIAEALEAAHEKGIVHRDLKPQNVKLTGDGTVKVLDFGLAKAMEAPGAGTPLPGDLARSPTLMNSPTLTAAHGTQLGMILGTAAYMAPEQARGGAVDKRADIWAFGVVLWEMLAGRGLFAADTVTDTLAGVLKNEIDLTSLPGETPPAVRRLLRRCLERNPKNRLHDIADARIALDEVLSGRTEEGASGAAAPAAARPVSVARRVAPWLGGALAGFALAAATIGRGSAPVPAESAAAASIRTLVSAGVSFDPSVSPDGRTVAFESTRDGDAQVWIKDLASGSESVLVKRRSVLPAFSPDGTSVLFETFEEGLAPEIHRISLATREARLVVRGGTQADWAPDGRSLVYLRDYDFETSKGATELVAFELDGGRERVLYRDPAQRLNGPSWSPDGRRVALVLNSFQAGSDDRVGLLDPEAGSLAEVSIGMPGQRGVKVRGMAWISPQRLALLVLDSPENVSGSGRIVLLDVEGGAPRSLLPVAAVGWGLDVAGPGSLIVGVGSSDQNLRESRRDSAGRWGAPELVTEGPFRDRQPAYSPDGRYLLFASNRGGNLDVWRRELGTGELARLTDHEADDWDPAYSADGSKLLFSSNRTGRYQVWIAESDGSSPRQVTDFENAQNPTLPGDGSWIFFVRQGAPEGQNGIWRIRPDGRDATLVAAGAYLVPDASPDGRYVAVRASGRHRLLRVADGAPLEIDTTVTDRHRWSVEDGRTFLWALGFPGPQGDIRRYPFDPASGVVGSVEVLLSGDATGRAESLGVAPDGSAVTFATVANRRGQLIRIDGIEGLAP